MNPNPVDDLLYLDLIKQWGGLTEDDKHYLSVLICCKQPLTLEEVGILGGLVDKDRCFAKFKDLFEPIDDSFPTWLANESHKYPDIAINREFGHRQIITNLFKQLPDSSRNRPLYSDDRDWFVKQVQSNRKWFDDQEALQVSPSIKRYFYRWLITHLIEDQQLDLAGHILMSLSFIRAKIRVLGVSSLLFDYSALLKKLLDMTQPDTPLLSGIRVMYKLVWNIYYNESRAARTISWQHEIAQQIFSRTRDLYHDQLESPQFSRSTASTSPSIGSCEFHQDRINIGTLLQPNELIQGTAIPEVNGPLNDLITDCIDFLRNSESMNTRFLYPSLPQVGTLNRYRLDNRLERASGMVTLSKDLFLVVTSERLVIYNNLLQEVHSSRFDFFLEGVQLVFAVASSNEIAVYARNEFRTWGSTGYAIYYFDLQLRYLFRREIKDELKKIIYLDDGSLLCIPQMDNVSYFQVLSSGALVYMNVKLALLRDLHVRDYRSVPISELIAVEDLFALHTSLVDGKSVSVTRCGVNYCLTADNRSYWIQVNGSMKGSNNRTVFVAVFSFSFNYSSMVIHDDLGIFIYNQNDYFRISIGDSNNLKMSQRFHMAENMFSENYAFINNSLATLSTSDLCVFDLSKPSSRSMVFKSNGTKLYRLTHTDDGYVIHSSNKDPVIVSYDVSCDGVVLPLQKGFLGIKNKGNLALLPVDEALDTSWDYSISQANRCSFLIQRDKSEINRVISKSFDNRNLVPINSREVMIVRFSPSQPKLYDILDETEIDITVRSNCDVGIKVNDKHVLLGYSEIGYVIPTNELKLPKLDRTSCQDFELISSFVCKRVSIGNNLIITSGKNEIHVVYFNEAKLKLERIKTFTSLQSFLVEYIDKIPVDVEIALHPKFMNELFYCEEGLKSFMKVSDMRGLFMVGEEEFTEYELIVTSEEGFTHWIAYKVPLINSFKLVQSEDTKIANSENLTSLYEHILAGFDAPLLSRVLVNGNIEEGEMTEIKISSLYEDVYKLVFFRSFVYLFQAFYAAIQVICSGIVKDGDEKTKRTALYIMQKLLQNACYHVPIIRIVVSILGQMIIEDEGIEEGTTSFTELEEKIKYLSQVVLNISSIDRVGKTLALNLLQLNIEFSTETSSYRKQLLSRLKQEGDEILDEEDNYDDSTSWLDNMRTAMSSMVNDVQTSIEQGLQTGIVEMVLDAGIKYPDSKANWSERGIGAEQATSKEGVEEVCSIDADENAPEDEEQKGIIDAVEMFLFVCEKINEGAFYKTYQTEEKMIEDMQKVVEAKFCTMAIMSNHFLLQLPDGKSLKEFQKELNEPTLKFESLIDNHYRVHYLIEDHPNDFLRNLITRISEEFPDCIAEPDFISLRDDLHDKRELSETVLRVINIDVTEGVRTHATIHDVDFPYPYIRKEEVIELNTGRVLETNVMIADHFLLKLPPRESPKQFMAKLNEPTLWFEPEPFADNLYRVHFPIKEHPNDFLRTIIRRISEKFPDCIAEPDFIAFGNASIFRSLKSAVTPIGGRNPSSRPLCHSDVGVIDSGISPLDGLTIISKAGGNFITIAGKKYNAKDTSHGTMCAGLIGGKFSVGRLHKIDPSIGVIDLNAMVPAKQLKIMFPGKNLEDRFVTTTSWEIDAIKHAITKNIKILNCSFGGPNFSEIQYSSYKMARNAGIAIITSAGNNGLNNDETPHFPSQFAVGGTWVTINRKYFRFTGLDNIICVAATNESNDPGESAPSKIELAKWSNYGGKSVHHAAPGTLMIGFIDEPYRGGSGTSFAAAYVSGLVGALVRQFKTKLPPKTLKYILQRSAKKVEALKEKLIFGGKLNAEKAMDNAHKYVRRWMVDRFNEIKSITRSHFDISGWITQCIKQCIEECIPECIQEGIRNRIHVVLQERSDFSEDVRYSLLNWIKEFLDKELRVTKNNLSNESGEKLREHIRDGIRVAGLSEIKKSDLTAEETTLLQSIKLKKEEAALLDDINQRRRRLEDRKAEDPLLSIDDTKLSLKKTQLLQGISTRTSNGEEIRPDEKHLLKSILNDQLQPEQEALNVEVRRLLLNIDESTQIEDTRWRLKSYKDSMLSSDDFYMLMNIRDELNEERRSYQSSDLINFRLLENSRLHESIRQRISNCRLDLSNESINTLQECLKSCIKSSIKHLMKTNINTKMPEEGYDITEEATTLLKSYINACIEEFLDDIFHDLKTIENFIEHDLKGSTEISVKDDQEEKEDAEKEEKEGNIRQAANLQDLAAYYGFSAKKDEEGKKQGEKEEKDTHTSQNAEPYVTSVSLKDVQEEYDRVMLVLSLLRP